MGIKADQFIISQNFKAFHAAREAAPVRNGLPITRDILLRLIASLDRGSHRGAALYVGFCLTFADFLRIGEFYMGILLVGRRGFRYLAHYTQAHHFGS